MSRPAIDRVDPPARIEKVIPRPPGQRIGAFDPIDRVVARRAVANVIIRTVVKSGVQPKFKIGLGVGQQHVSVLEVRLWWARCTQDPAPIHHVIWIQPNRRVGPEWPKGLVKVYLSMELFFNLGVFMASRADWQPA